jgi:hypothetical protein
MLATHNDAHHLCWLCADNVTGRSFNPISSIGTTQNSQSKPAGALLLVHGSSRAHVTSQLRARCRIVPSHEGLTPR